MPLDGLIQVGLTEYEAKAYVAIVTIGEGGINDISQASGIPRSRVYDVMERLAGKGFVETGATKPLRYRAVDPQIVTKNIRSHIQKTLDEVDASFKDFRKNTEQHSSPLWFILGERRIDTEAKDFINRAQDVLGIIVISNGLLVRYAPIIAERSKNVKINLVMEDDLEGFKGLLGKTKLLSMPDLSTTSLDWLAGIGFPYEDWTTKTKFEMVMFSGTNALLIYKEDEKRKALVVEGSIVGVFIHSVVEGVIKSARNTDG
ncbi:MAG: Sugar-specific transcriptional regulator TrmB [Methanomassiliicoccales archaeon PtaU1.Bin124]|nr:MAG: Sugar-specific transcriptional regulator TrmB [Methanomassiliicoccales archaeon PtaU1.Bin124]